MAKLGIALGSGPRGPGFESRHSDHIKALNSYEFSAFSYFCPCLLTSCYSRPTKRSTTYVFRYTLITKRKGLLSMTSITQNIKLYLPPTQKSQCLHRRTSTNLLRLFRRSPLGLPMYADPTDNIRNSPGVTDGAVLG